jgi:PAS domain S-box-containing protein
LSLPSTIILSETVTVSTIFFVLKTLAVIALVVAVFILWRKWRRSDSDARTQAIEQNKVLLNSILAGLGDACLLVKRDGEILYANEGADALLGSQYGVQGRRLAQLIPDEQITKFVQEAFTLTDGSQQDAFNVTVHPGGRKEERCLIVNAAPVHLPGDNEPRVRVVISDETRKRETEQIRRDFVANASHELRTPLAIINGYLENLLEGVIDDPVHTTKALTTMKKHGDRLARLVEDMLTISKFESAAEHDPAVLREQSFSCGECVQGVLDRLAPMFELKHARSQIAMPPNDAISGDRFYWDQIFFNLIENALKENKDDGRLLICIDMQRTENGVEIRVRDNGIGIPHEHLPFIFKRFYRVAKDHSQQKVKGTGLGLSIVVRAIQAHGGTIRVESSPGLRTEFIISLPDPKSGAAEPSAR